MQPAQEALLRALGEAHARPSWRMCPRAGPVARHPCPLPRFSRRSHRHARSSPRLRLRHRPLSTRRPRRPLRLPAEAAECSSMCRPPPLARRDPHRTDTTATQVQVLMVQDRLALAVRCPRNVEHARLGRPPALACLELAGERRGSIHRLRCAAFADGAVADDDLICRVRPYHKLVAVREACALRAWHASPAGDGRRDVAGLAPSTNARRPGRVYRGSDHTAVYLCSISRGMLQIELTDLGADMSQLFNYEYRKLRGRGRQPGS
mmetsp:Transcript_2087/g.5893  ORF Transcript_2087/g.5893 Transcript_2087/m.5893 type:complete len:264 (-) Transcript_2087:64-855(-)